MKKLTLVLAVLIVTAVLALSVSAHSFDDVPEGAWYEGYVSHVYDAGIMEGKAEGIFDPEGTVTRAEFVTVMARIAGESEDADRSYVASFSDADESAWYAPYMGWGVKTGLVKGQGDGKLAPASLVSRAELATFTARLMEYMNVILPDDPDAKGNFIFASHSTVPAQEIFRALKEQDIYVRFWNKDRISNHLRISVGTDAEMDKLIAALEKIVQK